jgi:hypothetical protein
VSEKTKKLLIALLPGEVCGLAAIIMLFRSGGNTNSLEFYLAVGSVIVGSVMTGLRLVAWNKNKE